MSHKKSFHKSNILQKFSLIKMAIPLLMATPFTMAAANKIPPASIETLYLPYGANISLDCAQIAMQAASHHANTNGWKVTINIADTAGQTVLLQRMDHAHRASPDFAQAKASSAVLTKRSTKLFSDALTNGRMAILGFADLHVHAAEGGEVLLHNGEIIGAIGVAGVTQEQDREIALMGARAVNDQCYK